VSLGAQWACVGKVLEVLEAIEWDQLSRWFVGEVSFSTKDAPRLAKRVQLDHGRLQKIE
jgi:hypothetical protein